METKFSLGKEIVDEIVAAQSRPMEVGAATLVPPMLWIGDGRCFKASSHAYDLIHRYARLTADEVENLTVTVSESEISELVAKAVASLIDNKGLDCISSSPPEEIVLWVDRWVGKDLEKRRVSGEYYFGCTLIHGEYVSRIKIGPILFEARAQWLERLHQERGLPKITERRIRARWAGKKQRPRKGNRDIYENSLVDAVGQSLMVCTVATEKQSIKVSTPKALLAGRLAMTAIALMWRRPSAILAHMQLEYDEPFHLRSYIVSVGPGKFTSSRSALGSRHGHYVDAEWPTNWADFQRPCAPIGECLSLFLDPDSQTERPKVLKALFMSLWWFHEACRERSDLIAIAKFASSMDSLAAGRRANGIKALIAHRLGRDINVAWLADGRSPSSLIKEIYEVTRNGVFHGSIKDFDRDWSSGRGRAEFVARQCLVASLYWMYENPSVADLRKLSEPEEALR